MSLRAAFFDLGGVLLRTEFQAPRQHLAESLGLDYEDIEKIVFGGGPNGSSARASVGEITEEEHWRNVLQMLKLPFSDKERVEREFFAGDVLDRDLIGFIRSLRSRCKTGLISNAWSGLRAYIEREEFSDAFDVLVISAEVGVAKPEAKIYQIALEQAGVSPEEALFVDDFEVNIEGCQAVGIPGLLFRNTEETISELKKRLNGI